MNVTIRKFVVGSIALIALVGVYLLYARFNRPPAIEAGLAKTVPAPVADVNKDSQGDVGKILDVGIGRVEQTRFQHRNERNLVDRVFGFDQLLHRQGNQWVITNPYMQLFLPTFQCVVTANRGTVQVDTAFSRPMAGDALFSGNVVIHIIPAEPNNILECFIHLDDVGFLAAKSLFSSAGAVRFLSRRAQLTGTGMELLYDEGRSRLELFRIFNLDSLRLRSRELGSVADLTPQRRTANTAASQDPLVRQAAIESSPPKPPGDCYECVFHSNVTIDMPDRVITARDMLSIDNILWAGSKNTDAPAQRAADPNDSNSVPYPGPNALDTTASSHLAMSSIPPEFFDTIVTCDGGFEITPQDGRQKTEDRGRKAEGTMPRAEDGVPSSVVRPPSSGFPDRQRATAQQIHFDAFTTDTTLVGPVAMAFLLDPNGLPAKKPAAQTVPMTVTAQKSVRFLAAANQVLFDDDCRVTLSKSEPNVTYEYTLTAPRLVLDIASDANGPKGGLNVNARKLVTDGGPAALRILRRSPNKLLGWTTLDAAQLQYEADPQRFTAIGPGEIRIRNDEIINPKADPNQFSLGRPCFACLTNFDTLTYWASTNRIVVEDKSQQLLLNYFPRTDGKYDRGTQVVAGYVEAALKEIAKGRLELVSLAASKGIEYEDEKNHVNFAGSSLLYDYSQAQVTVRGDDEQRCYLNGALVDQIDLNLKTGRIQAEIPTPSTFQVRR